MLLLLMPLLLAFTSLLANALAYPPDSHSRSTALGLREESKFILGAMGDSWASAVTDADNNRYDDNTNCMRSKHAWSTVVNAEYANWAPYPDKQRKFELVACAGAKLEDMPQQMDQMTRPNLVLMEAGLNGAFFYPMADACLFQASPSRDYGKSYETDNLNNIMGDCRMQINNAKEDIAKMVELVKNTINAWRRHPSVANNGATLFVLGYSWLFGPEFDPACDEWNFGVVWANGVQSVKGELRKEFNGFIDLMNGAILEAVKSFNDDNIQYVDINPAFNGHRFCEPGHGRMDQYNWGHEVWYWNNPTKLVKVTVTDGDKATTYNIANGELPPKETIDKLNKLSDGSPGHEGNMAILAWANNVVVPGVRMTWEVPRPKDEKEFVNNKDFAAFHASSYISKTLRPTEDGHRAIAGIVIQQLKKHYKR